MKLWDGEMYLDDRLFILDLQQATKGKFTLDLQQLGKGKRDVWAVTRRRNTKSFPPSGSDDFTTEEEAVDYIMRVEPATPRISLEGDSPQPKLTYEEHLLWCKSEGIPSAMEMYRLKQGTVRRKLIIEELSPEDFETDPDGQESVSVVSSPSTSETLYRQTIQEAPEENKKWFTDGDETIHVKYVGETKDGVPHGIGTETVSFDPHKGQKYVGEWKDGKYHGQGTLTSVNGSKHVGGFKDGMIHGQGTYTDPDGDKHVGGFSGGKFKDGNMIATYSEGIQTEK